ncbi:MAG: IclR family transcriptional regulator [Gammaproteobacteria bacterium]|nr:IclR family transcriptional regulator [Gammaproteobacteria bacterium]
MARSSESSIVAKCAQVIDILSNARKPLGFKEITESSGMVKSSAHRILSVLLSEDLVEYDQVNKVYREGSRLNAWGRAIWRRLDMQMDPAAELEAICEHTNMNAALSILDGDSVLYLRTLNSVPYRQASHPGDHAPLHSTAAGKVFLANLPVHRREILMNSMHFERMTEHTIQDSARLQSELDAVQENGYGMAVQEEHFQVIGMAAPIRDIQGNVSACLSLWSLIDLTNVDRVKNFAPELIATTERISRQSGYEPD